MVASQNEFGSLPSSAIFWKSLSRIGISSSLNFWQNSAVKPSGPGLLFAGRFLITVSISMLVMGVLRFSDLSRIGISSSLNFWQNSAVKPSGPGLLFAGRFLITVSISILVMGVLRFSISSWSSFGKLYFSKNWYIFSTLSILLAYNC